MQVRELVPALLDRIIDRALEEDLAGGDITTEACIDPLQKIAAHATARHALVVSGGPVFRRVFERVDESLRVEFKVPDGVHAAARTVLWSVVGHARSILVAERTALNLVQRMSGIATLTRKYVDELPSDSSTRITDTRKTTPGLRILERYAVRCGGGHNHRDQLGSSVLIKDNHIVACGSVHEAIRRARTYASHTCTIECEVDRLDQLSEAIDAGADIVLLDNMNLETIRRAVVTAEGRVLLEASGGITLGRIRDLAEAGVDAISVGALTHSAPAVDIGLDFVPLG